MEARKPVLVIAGEMSGDLHAAGLVREARRLRPGLTFYGIGGPRMREAGVETLFDVEDMAVMGLWAVLRRLPFFARVFRDMKQTLARRRPGAVLLVDFPEFNLRFAPVAHRLGVRVVYYVCPQVWAWRRGRIPGMAASIDRLLSIFPFEAAHFAGTGLPVDFVGHPLVEETRAALDAPRAVLPWTGEPRIALLPGSRENEVDRLLPPMWRAAALLEARHPDASFIAASPSPRIEALVRERIAQQPPGPSRWAVVCGATREVLRQADAAIVASGTATVEAALMRCPMVVVYRTGRLTYALCRRMVRVPHIGMVNIIAGRELCPELIQQQATGARMAAAVEAILGPSERHQEMLRGLDGVREALGTDASARAAALLIEELEAPARNPPPRPE